MQSNERTGGEGRENTQPTSEAAENLLMTQEPSCKILVVDDDERTLKAFARSRSETRMILTVSTGNEALAVVRDEQLNLVILDLRLGNESGEDVLRAIRVHDSSLPVVIMSGYLSVAATVSLLKNGATAVVFKPVSLGDVLRQLTDSAFDGPSNVVPQETPSLARAEWEHMMRVLHDCGGKVSVAAKRLRIRRVTLQRKLKKDPPER